MDIALAKALLDGMAPTSLHTPGVDEEERGLGVGALAVGCADDDDDRCVRKLGLRLDPHGAAVRLGRKDEDVTSVLARHLDAL